MLKTFVALALAGLTAFLAPGQNASDPTLKASLERLRDSALTSDYAYRQVAYLTSNIGPRLSGSPQADQAVQYVAEQMRRLGLEVRLEKVMATHWVRGLETAELTTYKGQAPGTTQRLVVTALGGSVATPANGISAPVIVVNDFAELQARGRAGVEGKIVVFNTPFDQKLAMRGYAEEAYVLAAAYRRSGAAEAARLGAVAALNRSAGGANYRLPHTGAMQYVEGVKKIPAGSLTAEDAELVAFLAQQGEVRMKLVLTPTSHPNKESANVIADIRGTEYPDKIVVVSGHLDSWDLGTGAIDDGVGIATAMEVGNLIQQLKLKPKATIRIIAYMDEECGLTGGVAYAANQGDRVNDHLAAIELDSGAGHPTGFYAHVANEALPRLQLFSDVLLKIGAPIVQRVDSSVGADISLLEARGVPGFSPITDDRAYFDYHHTPADTLDKVVPRELAENAAVMAVLAYGLANLPLPRIQTTGGNGNER